MDNNITIHSLGIYSSWCYHKPARVLFDCGEGCASAFRNFIYGVENIFISHGHGDHVLGLPSFVGIRNSVRGDKEKPLNVFYPRDNYSIIDLIEFINKRNHKLSYELNFHPIDINGIKFDIGNGKEIHSIRSEHQRNALTFCYKIVDKRSKLRPEYQGKNIPQLIKSGIKKVDMMVNYDHVEFAYLLDSCGFDVNSIKDATEIVIDCTFLNRKDREDPTHFCLEEVIDICERANVGNITLAHISPRYSRGEIVNAIKHLPSKYKVSHPIYGELYPNSK